MVVDGMTSEVIEKGGRDMLSDRGYFDHVPTEKGSGRWESVVIPFGVFGRAFKAANV